MRRISESLPNLPDRIFLNVAGIVDGSIVDGPGVRYTIFMQGCSHRCPGCHNPHTHSFDGGVKIMLTEIIENLSRNKYIKAVTFSGGEPFDQPEALAASTGELKRQGYHILVYTGYLYEDLLIDDRRSSVLSYVDILIDGRFDIEKRSLDLNFRGSSNQRIIDVAESSLYKTVVEKVYDSGL